VITPGTYRLAIVAADRRAGVQIINTEGSALIGPGSEWFWSMLQFVVVAVTLVGIYYQLRIAQSANAFAQLDVLVSQWQGELLVRRRLGVLYTLRDGVLPEQLPDAPTSFVADYWEKVGSLVRAGHIAPTLIAEGLGGSTDWWAILAPWVLRIRTEEGNPGLWEHFEWLAATIVRSHPAMALDQEAFERSLEQRIIASESALRDLEALRR
jgi:hypothetical protein